MIRCVVILLTLAGTASAEEKVTDRRVASAANSLGMQRYRAGDLAGAAEQFRVAIEFDREYVVAHYNLACVTSRLGDRETALRELRWLSTSKDPGAKQKLQKAASDPDLDFISVLPEVRKLVGAPEFGKLRPSQWLMERNGVWSTETQGDCEERTYSLRFGGDGSLALEVKERCGEQPVEGRFWGKLELSPLAVAVTDWKSWPGAVPLVFEPCADLDAPGSCFVLSNGKKRLGPFHRGKPFQKPRPSVAATASKSG